VKSIEELTAEHTELGKQAQQLQKKISSFEIARDWENPEYRQLTDERYALYRKAQGVLRKIKNIWAEAASKKKPVFITWKKYGFRHISIHEVEDPTDYHGHPYTIIRGVAACGQDWWVSTPNEGDSEPPWYLREHHDHRSKARPLCGLCRRKWKSLTGKTLN
jgi:hypothetical protein